jgi:anti-anti-sigma factor
MGTEGPSPTPSPALAVVDTVGAVAVVRVTGEIDMVSRDAVERTVNRALDGDAEAVVVDLTGVTFFGSSGLQMLAEARQHARARAVPVRLVVSSRRVLRPLEITGMTAIFPVHASVEDALSG